jgi:hypothetical protein
MFKIAWIMITGMPTGLFLTGNGFRQKPGEIPYVFNPSLITSSESPANVSDIALVLYETPQVDVITNSKYF